MSVWYLVGLFSLQPNPGVPALSSTESAGVVVYEDQRGAVVYLSMTADSMQLSSILPAGWTFNLTVDGNKDSKWGYASGMPDPTRRTSSDKKFGQDARNGIFCSQYVYTRFEHDPTQIETSSQCGDLPSKGRAILSGLDSENRATIALEIPADEVFGTETSANIQVCVWDTARWTCQHKLPNLLTVTR